MSRAIPAGLKVASRRRRLGAWSIDMVVFVPPVLAVGGGGVALYVWWVRRHGRELEFDPSKISTRWEAVLWAGFEVARVPARNWRSPGYRALGLRRVDVRTGEPLSVRDVLVYDAVAFASGQLRGRLTRPWMAQRRRRLEELKPELKNLERAHAGDFAAQQRAMSEVLKREGLNPARSCAAPLLGAALLQAPALWSPLNQTVTERLTGIIVVQD